MRPRSIASLVTVIIAVAIFGFALVRGGGESGNKEDPAEVAHAKAVKDGGELYARYCAFCHGKHGEGFAADEANALGNQNFLKSVSDDFITQGIKRGRPGTSMSAWGKKYGGVLGDDDVKALLAFIRSWQTEESVPIDNKAVVGDAKVGARTYAAVCAHCHGDKGQGGTAVSLNNPVYQETASDGYIRYAISEGRPGTPMPAFGKQVVSESNGRVTTEQLLPASDINNLVAYMRTLKTDAKAVPETEDVDPTFTEGRLKNAILNPGGKPAEFLPHQGRYVPADTVYAAMAAGESFVIIDARPFNDYLKAHVKGAISVPFYDVDKAVGRLPTDLWIIAYCVCPHAMSGKAVDRLRQHGFEKTAIIDEGFWEWAARGYPVIEQQPQPAE